MSNNRYVHEWTKHDESDWYIPDTDCDDFSDHLLLFLLLCDRTNFLVVLPTIVLMDILEGFAAFFVVFDQALYGHVH